MRQRQPGVHGEQRHLDGEAGEHRQEHPDLERLPKIPVVRQVARQVFIDDAHQVGNRERECLLAHGRLVVARHHDGQERQEEYDAAGQRVNEELPGRMTPFRPPPNADEKEQRHQRQFEKDVEQNHIKRQKDAEQTRSKQKQPGVILVNALADRLPGDQHRRHHEHGGEDDQPNVDAVHADIKLHGPQLAEVDEIPRRLVGIGRIGARHHLRLKSVRRRLSRLLPRLRKVDHDRASHGKI